MTTFKLSRTWSRILPARCEYRDRRGRCRKRAEWTVTSFDTNSTATANFCDHHAELRRRIRA